MKTRLKVIRESSLKQKLWKEFLIGSKVIYRKLVDSEEIPLHVSISLACFGDTSGWISKFAPFDEKGIKQEK